MENGIYTYRGLRALPEEGAEVNRQNSLFHPFGLSALLSLAGSMFCMVISGFFRRP